MFRDSHFGQVGEIEIDEKQRIVLIGTLISFTFAMVVGYSTKWAIGLIK